MSKTNEPKLKLLIVNLDLHGIYLKVVHLNNDYVGLYFHFLEKLGIPMSLSGVYDISYINFLKALHKWHQELNKTFTDAEFNVLTQPATESGVEITTWTLTAQKKPK